MRKKRVRSVLAMVLVLSMIFGSNTMLLADEVSDNIAPVEEEMTEPSAPEEAQIPDETEQVSGNGDENPVLPADQGQEEEPVKEEISEDEIGNVPISDDRMTGDTVSDNEEPVKEEISGNDTEESAGADETVKLYVSGDTVSYNGEDHGITISSNISTGVSFNAWIISASENKELHEYTEADYIKGISQNDLSVSSDAAVFYISKNSAVNAGIYAISVNAVKNGQISANAVVFLSVNKAGPISLSINGKTKYYDRSNLLPDGKVYEVDGKELYKNTIKNKNDIELIKVSGSQNNAGSSYIKLDVSEISQNYVIDSVSAGKLTVLSTNLIIRSKSFKKNYDKKKITDEQRKGFTIEAPGADVKTLSSNLNLTVDDFTWDPTSLISGDTVTASQNKFVLNDQGKNKIYGAGNSLSKNYASVTLIPGNLTLVRHDWTSNDLTAPVISSVKLNEKGFVTITWKEAKTYKNKDKKDSKKTAGEKKMDKPRYMIYRYDDVHEDWILLNGANKTKKSDKESDIKYGQTATKFVDKQAGREDKSTYIYKVNVIGYDRNGKYGMAREWSYKMCAPMGLSLSTKQHDTASLDFRFSKIRGTGTYVIERSLTGKKSDFDEVMSVSQDRIAGFEYYGTKLASPLTYKNNGEPVKAGVIVPAEGVYVTQNKLDPDTPYYYRAYAKSSVVEFGEDGAVLDQRKEVQSAASDILKAKCKPYAPYMISAGSARYDRAAIAFERLSEDIIPIGSAKKYKKYKYEILQSTNPASGFKVVATLTGKDLGGEVSGLTEVSKNALVSLNGVRYQRDYPSYIYLIKGLKPEITYYFKVRVVLDKKTGVQSDALSVKPQMTDVSSISANVNNYNKVTITTDHPTGAKQMVITYRATMTHKGKVLSENSNNDSKWKKKTFDVKKDSNNDPITKFAITGLKNGYTYIFYAEPKNGKKHVTANPKTVTATTKLGAPKITTTPKDMDEIYVSWNAIKGATKYELCIYDVENDNALVLKKTFKKPGRHTWRGGSGGSLDPKKGKTNKDLVGKPYRFEVRAFRKDSYFPEGQWGLTAEKTDSGRPRGVKDLKVEVNKVKTDDGYTYYPDGHLTWNHSADFSQSTPMSYMVERKVFKYRKGTDNSFEKTGTTQILRTKEKAKSLIKKDKDGKYTSSKGFRNTSTKVPFYHGDKVVYIVTPVYYSDTAKKYGRGPDKDGYILGVPKKVVYITPAKIVLERTEVTVGSSKEVPISYLPKSTTIKEVEWGISATGQKYFTLEGSKVKGKTAMSKWNNDVYVRATGRISISGSRIPSNKALIKVNPKGMTDGKLKVCIDAGHGGSDSGATQNGMLEKTCNLDMAYAMKSELEAYGVPVVMTRYDDTYLSVGDRPNIAYSNGCNLFISIHCNSGGGSGTEVWKSITDYHDDTMANKILSNVTSAIGTGNRGVKTRTGSNGDYYGVIRGAAANKITGMIVEVAFMDGDYSKLNNSANRQAAGKAIADAVLESKGYK